MSGKPPTMLCKHSMFSNRGLTAGLTVAAVVVVFLAAAPMAALSDAAQASHAPEADAATGTGDDDDWRLFDEFSSATEDDGAGDDDDFWDDEEEDDDDEDDDDAQRRVPEEAVQAVKEGDAAYAKREFAEAVSFYTKAVAAAPRYVKASLHLAAAQLEVSDTSGAKMTLHKALQINPHVSRLHDMVSRQ